MAGRLPLIIYLEIEKKQDNKIILYIIRRVVVKCYSNYQKALAK